MKPVSPVVEGMKEVVFAKDQPQYLPLPAVICEDGTVISRWRLTLKERIKIFFTGDLWLNQMTFHKPLQPQLPSVDKPTLIFKYGKSKWMSWKR
jgi:hypothetical protein